MGKYELTTRLDIDIPGEEPESNVCTAEGNDLKALLEQMTAWAKGLLHLPKPHPTMSRGDIVYDPPFHGGTRPRILIAAPAFDEYQRLFHKYRALVVSVITPAIANKWKRRVTVEIAGWSQKQPQSWEHRSWDCAPGQTPIERL